MIIADPSYVSRKAILSDTRGYLFLPFHQKVGVWLVYTLILCKICPQYAKDRV